MTIALTLAAAALAGVAAAAFFSACEAAFLSLAGPPSEPPETAPSGPARLLARPERLQHALALGHLLAVVWTAALAWEAARAWTGPRPGWAMWAAAVVVAALGLVVAGELVPKALATERAGPWARRAAPVLRVWLILAAPVTAAAGAVTRAVERSVGPGPAAAPISSEDVRTALAETTARAGLETGEREMITSIFSFGETTAREVMTPRPDVFAIEESTPWERVVRSVREAEFSRVPLYRETLDTVVGVVYAKDLLAVVHGQVAPPVGLADLARSVVFVPEGRPIDDLLRQFQRERLHLAIVADEYGGTAGLVTLEDILEELVGEIQDEYDRETPLAVRLPDGSLRLDGRLDADDFNELTGCDIGVVGVETIGGIVAREMGRVPRAEEAVELAGWRFVVEAVEDRRVVRVRAARSSPAQEEEAP
ncbi:MAG TPA: hemolysin family protein [Gemmatimonadota bacterium]|nr:hemolysin family protein [Gemmatimonadota bacterium]